MAESSSYKDLIVWKKSIDLVEMVYQMSSSFPEEEKFGLQSQMRRAAISIPSNIAEGKCRSKKLFSNYLSISLGSLMELETQLIIAERIKFIGKTKLSIFLKMTDEIGKMINGLKSAIESR